MDIASGPTVATLPAVRMRSIVRRFPDRAAPPAPARCSESGAGETIKPGDERLARVSTQLIATLQMAPEGRQGRRAGRTPAAARRQHRGRGQRGGRQGDGRHRTPGRPGTASQRRRVLLSVGETTVTVKGDGRGGRNVEFCSRWRSRSRACPCTLAGRHRRRRRAGGDQPAPSVAPDMPRCARLGTG